MRSKHRGRSQWTALVQEFGQGNFSIKEFCLHRGISYWTFREWRRKLATESVGNDFVERSPLPWIGAGGTIRIRIKNIRVEVSTPVDELALASVLRAVERSRC